MSESPIEETEDKSLQYWRAVRDMLKQCLSELPGSEDPRKNFWTYDDEEWKNEAEMDAKEEESWGDTDTLIERYCSKHTWPKRSKNDARFFAARRLQWAIGFIRVFGVARASNNESAIPRPSESGWDFIQWLLIDAYGGRNPPPVRTPFYMSMTQPDGTMKVVTRYS